MCYACAAQDTIKSDDFPKQNNIFTAKDVAFFLLRGNKLIFLYYVDELHCTGDNKAKEITLVWACTENGRKQNSQKSIIYEFGINKTER